MEVTELPAHANLNDKAKEGALAINALSGLWVTMGIFEIPEDDFLERLGTKPLNVRSTINRFWANQKF